jgi:hypothetical protein
MQELSGPELPNQQRGARFGGGNANGGVLPTHVTFYRRNCLYDICLLQGLQCKIFGVKKFKLENILKICVRR